MGGLSNWWDRLLERLAHLLGRALWREMKLGASKGFQDNNAGVQTLQVFADKLSQGTEFKYKLHLVGHSTGGILLADLLRAMERIIPELRINTCSLLAPASTLDLYEVYYQPLLANDTTTFGIDQMTIYNLSSKLELDDTVGPYRKSLLYFVSHSFEEKTPAPILGMQVYSRELEGEGIPNQELVYSYGDSVREPRTLSTVHGGFDNDPATLNDILKRVLGNKKPAREFTRADLDY